MRSSGQHGNRKEMQLTSYLFQQIPV
jgi:hypothetical protein